MLCGNKPYAIYVTLMGNELKYIFFQTATIKAVPGKYKQACVHSPVVLIDIKRKITSFKGVFFTVCDILTSSLIKMQYFYIKFVLLINHLECGLFFLCYFLQ